MACATAILSAALYVCVKDLRWLYSATDKFFIVGRLFRSVIMHTLLLSIKQLKSTLSRVVKPSSLRV